MSPVQSRGRWRSRPGMAGPAALLAWAAAAAAVAVATADAGHNLCYSKARSNQVVATTKSHRFWSRGRLVTRYYTEYAVKAVPTVAAACCPGYRPGSRGRCQPVCEPACPPPKVCAAPNSCQCPGHLVKDGGGRCVEPLCLNRVCEHGFCNPSGVCVCESGYRWREDSYGGHCEPVCPGGCNAGGRCTAPNTCVCGDGFQRATAGSGCEPVSCPPGYELRQNGSLGARTCKPVCLSGCPHGSCTAPDTCDCAAGFHPGRRPDGAFTCEPLCPSGCPHGSCTAPDTCNCTAGFQPGRRQDGAATCVALPRCWRNGYIVGHDTCRCLDGYKLPQGDEGRLICEPDCGDKCGPHADCVAPDTCVCVQGYRDDRSSFELDQKAAIRCAPICAQGCGNGRCVAPRQCQCANPRWRGEFYSCSNGSCGRGGSCSCWRGYQLVPGRPRECVPHCDPPCGNGSCVAPNRCICSEGYELRGGRCVPKCSSNCGYGTCVAPERCECRPGFELATDEAGRETCAPACHPPCVHGTCEVPGRCACWRGYALDGAACRPVCSRPCVNADCVAPDTCGCWPGFASPPGGGWACEPTCNATCVNATCTAPDTCTCLDGLVHDGEDPSGATCGPPCPDHLCSVGEPECLADTGEPGCVCDRGRRRPPCDVSATPPGGRVAWPLLLLLLVVPGLAAVALLAFVRIRNRRKKSAAGDVPPYWLSTTTSDGASPMQSTSDEYDDAGGFYTSKKKLIKCAKKHRNPNISASHCQCVDPGDGLYEQIGGETRSPFYGEAAYSEIGHGNALRDPRKLEPNSTAEGGGQMAENDFYGDPAGKEWCRASVHQVANDLYAQRDSRPQGNAPAQVDLDAMYAKVVKKADRRSAAKTVDDDFYGQPSRNTLESSSVRVTPTGPATEALCQKSAAQQVEGHYEEVTDVSNRPTELLESRKGRPAKQQEEQQYEEIGDVRSKQVTEMVDNDLYRGCGRGVGSGSVHEEVDVGYEEIVKDADRGSGEMTENSLYDQR